MDLLAPPPLPVLIFHLSALNIHFLPVALFMIPFLAFSSSTPRLGGSRAVLPILKWLGGIL